MPAKLEFFFDYVSFYSYLASTQVEAVAQRSGAELVWRPFLLGAVMKVTGSTPVVGDPHKGPYAVKDVADWARHYGLPEVKLPDGFPFRTVTLMRLALVALEHGGGAISRLTHAAYRAAFAEARDPSDPAVTEALLREAGLEPAAALARAEAPDIKDALRRNTDEALARGAFGAPTFFVNGTDMYFGNDRLVLVERALQRAR